jgi:hypothetical protein
MIFVNKSKWNRFIPLTSLLILIIFEGDDVNVTSNHLCIVHITTAVKHSEQKICLYERYIHTNNNMV